MRIHIYFAVFACLAQLAVADDVTLTSFKTIPQYLKLDSVVWKTSAGDETAWGDYNEGSTLAHIKHVGGSASSSGTGKTFNFGGLVIELSSRTTWALIEATGESNKLTIGDKGVDVKSGSYFLGARNAALIELTADQTWTGSHASGNTYFSIGDISGAMPRTPLVAAEGVTSLTIAGRLQAALYGHDNQLSSVTVTVKDTAMLRLPETADARLGAAKLVLADAGSRMAFGSEAEVRAWYYPSDSAWAPKDVVAIDHEHLAPVVELRDGAGFTALKGVYGLTNLCVSGTATSTVSGDLTFTQAVTRVTFLNAGAALALNTSNAVAGVAGCALEAVGAGTLSVADARAFSRIDVAAGTTVAVAGTTDHLTLMGAGTVSIPSGTTLYVRPSDMTAFTGAFTVDGGELVLDAALPAGRVTVNSGSVLYGTDPLIVTDAVRSEAKLTVASGETLRVFGDGLTAATSLELSAGTLRFECAATVASPVTLALDTSYIETAALSVTGTVSGVLTSAIPASGRETQSVKGTVTRGPGCLRLTGGGTWNNYRPNSFLTLDGSVWFSAGTYTFRNTSCGLHYSVKSSGTWGRRWLVTDTAKIKISGYNDSYATDLRVSGLEHDSNRTFCSILEVRDGGEVEVAANAYILLGYLQANGYLIVGDGGTVRVTHQLGSIRFGYSTTTTGIVDLREGGLIETASPFLHAMQGTYQTWQTQGHFIWNGGTVKVLSNFPETEATLFRNLKRVNESWTDVNGSLRTWVKVTGETCTLDLTDLPERAAPLANVPAGLERSEWFGTGALTVKGGKTFVMQSFPNGITLKLEGAGTRVILPEDVEIHDYATRCATEDVAAGKLEYETLADCLEDLSLAEFVVAGRGVVLTNAEPTCDVAIGTAHVTADGEFHNAGTLVSPAAVSVTNLVFAENSILGDVGGGVTFTVQGEISLPATTMRYESLAQSDAPAYRALGSVLGSPASWTKVGRRERRVIVKNVEGTISLQGGGCCISIR